MESPCGNSSTKIFGLQTHRSVGLFSQRLSKIYLLGSQICFESPLQQGGNWISHVTLIRKEWDKKLEAMLQGRDSRWSYNNASSEGASIGAGGIPEGPYTGCGAWMIPWIEADEAGKSGFQLPSLQQDAAPARLSRHNGSCFPRPHCCSINVTLVKTGVQTGWICLDSGFRRNDDGRSSQQHCLRP